MPVGPLARHMGSQVIDGHFVGLVFTFPRRTALLQPDITGGNITIGQRQPAFKAKSRPLQRHVVLHPFTEPRFYINIIRLQPDFTFVQQPVVVAQIHAHLHDAVLPVQAGEIDLPFGAMTIFTVEPGELWDRQFSPLPGERDEADFAVAQIEMIELTQEKIADAVGLNTFAVFAIAQWGIG
ncbi:hypothetical protein D3C71_881980 [compost metagenome]